MVTPVGSIDFNNWTGLFFKGQTTKVGRLAMADDKGGSPAKVSRPFVKFLQSKKYAYDYEHYIGISTRDQTCVKTT